MPSSVFPAELPQQAINKHNIANISVKVLIDAVRAWKPGEGHELVVLFPLSCRETIRDWLNVWCEFRWVVYQLSNSAKAKGALSSCRCSQMQKLCKATFAARRA